MTRLRMLMWWVVLHVITGAIQNPLWPAAERPWTEEARKLVPHPVTPCRDLIDYGVDKGDLPDCIDSDFDD